MRRQRRRIVDMTIQPSELRPRFADSLFPEGRPICGTCGRRPVYLAGQCGDCFAEAGRRQMRKA